ncbi:hypothetical protein CROQUDRAFT_99677 [Cronartium quercuum f. sp. fusiforme G11]|uniref:Secreted protein n=1 Tax=Cronartium quercuum f. sp. fusiforme G11 TaxID=708437 RepID=A0A9P6N829_9BASI|nr:hypothetical protein CROQUDRAFT_99677 [Cronartium quercuum f. sp. fusiforme G11]
MSPQRPQARRTFCRRWLLSRVTFTLLKVLATSRSHLESRRVAGNLPVFHSRAQQMLPFIIQEFWTYENEKGPLYWGFRTKRA